MRTRYDYHHGPEKASHPKTTHRHGSNILLLRKTERTQGYGWCQLCEHKDVVATDWATWLPEDRRISVCADCAEREDVVLRTEESVS